MIEKNRISHLDGLRGIAVLLVFFSHTAGRGFALHPSLNFMGLGHIGVYLFFVLSAFFLGNGLFNEEINCVSVSRFYIKRIFRILPLYYSLLIVVFLCQQIFQYENTRYLHISGGVKGFLRHLFLYQGDGVFWSVVVEMQFYIVVPFIILLLVKYKEKALVFLWIIALINFLLYTSKYMKWPFSTSIISVITPNDRGNGWYLDLFMGGITASYFLKYHLEVLERNRRKIALISLFLFLSLILTTVILVSKDFLIFHEPFYKFRYISLLYALIFGFFTLSVYLGNPANKILDNTLIKHVGIWGFSVYLLHMAVFQFVNLFNFSPQIGFFLSLAILMFVSYLSYTFIEKKSLWFGYVLIDKLKLNNKAHDQNKR
jgi:peptidoglycan/LPS O-acetylase OafA/YrhL